MKLTDIQTPLEQHKVLMYARDGNKVVRHRKTMRKIAENIYAGEPQSDGYSEYCDIYLVFDGIERGIKFQNTSANYEVQQIVDRIMQDELNTPEGIENRVKDAIANAEYIPMLYVEFLAQFKPELVPDMMESRKQYAEKMAQKRKERAAKQEAEDAEYIKQRNAEAEAIVGDALEILRNGGKLENKAVRFYKSRYDYNTYYIVNYLCRKYGVNLPLRTAGWVNDKLAALIIQDGTCSNLQYYRLKKTDKASKVIYEYINQLIAAVKAS